MLAFGTDNDEITAECPGAPFLLTMQDHPDNELSVIIALPSKGEKGEGLDLSLYPPEAAEKLKDTLPESYPVYGDANRVYEIRFPDYVMYQCRNESYTVRDDYEIRIGKYLCIYERSRLLDYYGSVLFDWDSEDTKAERRHYGIGTENHIIDIISNSPPVISKADPALYQEYFTETEDE